MTIEKTSVRKKTVTRKPTYGDAVLWLASNETPEHDRIFLACLNTMLLVSYLFGVEPSGLVTDVLKARHGSGRWNLPKNERCKCNGKW